jgi:hypothetical protein
MSMDYLGPIASTPKNVKAWLEGFSEANDLVDTRRSTDMQTTASQVERTLGVVASECCGGPCVMRLEGIAETYGFGTSDEQYAYVIGVYDSVKANNSILGASNV